MVWLGISKLAILNPRYHAVLSSVLLRRFPLRRDYALGKSIRQPDVTELGYLHQLVRPRLVMSAIVGARLAVENIKPGCLMTEDECQWFFRALSSVDEPNQFPGLEPQYRNAMGSGRFWPQLSQLVQIETK